MSKYGLKGFNNDNNDYPKTFAEFNEKSDTYKKMMDTLLKNHLFKTKINTSQEFVDNMTKLYLSKINNFDHIANSKLMQLHFFSLISSLSKKKLNQFITELFFLGQKRGEGFGPFGKIY